MLVDFNFHVNDLNSRAANQIVTALKGFNLEQLVSGPTHKAGHVLELTFSNLLNVHVKHALNLICSDHFLITFMVFTILSDRWQDVLHRTSRA